MLGRRRQKFRAKLDALVDEMEDQYTAGVDYVPDEEEGIPGDGVEPRLDSAAPAAPEPEPESGTEEQATEPEAEAEP